MEQLEAEAVVFSCDDYGSWAVEAFVKSLDSALVSMVFCGADAEQHAFEYAKAKFTDHTRHEPRPRRPTLTLVV